LVIVCARGEVKKEITPASGHASKNACPHNFKKSGELPKFIYVTHKVISEERKKDMMSVNKIRCFIVSL